MQSYQSLLNGQHSFVKPKEIEAKIYQELNITYFVQLRLNIPCVSISFLFGGGEIEPP
jgi:hypothetical protein